MENKIYPMLEFGMFSEDVRELAKALNKCQLEFPPTGKSGVGNRGKYATVNDVYDAVVPVLIKNDIRFFQGFVFDKDLNHMIMVTTLLHIPSGQWIKDERPIVPDGETQQLRGAAQTFQRRYALLLICGVCPEEDDDGEAGRKHVESQVSEPISDNQAIELIKLIKSYSNAATLNNNICKFNKVSDLRELPASKYKYVVDYINKTGTRNEN